MDTHNIDPEQLIISEAIKINDIVLSTLGFNEVTDKISNNNHEFFKNSTSIRFFYFVPSVSNGYNSFKIVVKYCPTSQYSHKWTLYCSGKDSFKYEQKMTYTIELVNYLMDICTQFGEEQMKRAFTKLLTQRQ